MFIKVGNRSETARLAKMLRELGDVVTYDPGGRIELAHGGFSDFYVDVKKTYGYPEVRHAILRMLVRNILENIGRPDFVAVAGYGGLPLGTLISEKFGIKLSMVRDKEKDHGRGGLIDGYVPKAGEVGIAVDDVLTTGKSLKDIASVIRRTRARIVNFQVVVKREDPKLNFDVGFLLTAEDIQ